MRNNIIAIAIAKRMGLVSGEDEASERSGLLVQSQENAPLGYSKTIEKYLIKSGYPRTILAASNLALFSILVLSLVNLKKQFHQRTIDS